MQLVLRPTDQFRGYAGQVASGTIRVGDPVVAWPSGRTAHVRRIATYDRDLDMAFAPMSVALALDHEIDISRGDVLAMGLRPGDRGPTVEYPPIVGHHFEAEVVWMDERPLDPGRVYLLKHAARTVTAEVGHGLLLNQIGTVAVSTGRPLVFDRYEANRTTGSFVLIDPSTNFTAGAGMIVGAMGHGASSLPRAPVSAAERLALAARQASSEVEAIEAVRKALEEILT